MKYILMMHAPYGKTGEYQMGEWPPQAVESHLEYLRRLNDELTEAGELVGIEGLTPPSKAKVVRAGADGSSPVVTDGPFPESKEFLAGWWIVDVDSPERAHEIAAKGSAAPGPDGRPLNMAIEVRRVMDAPPADG